MLRVAIAGCGWAAEWQMRDGFARLPHLYLPVACCDLDPQRARAFATRWQIPDTAADFSALLATPDIDVVSICTPPRLHCDMILSALAAGRHVICEKPLVASLLECDRVAMAEAASSGRVMPVFQFRFGNGAERVRHAIASGILGRHYLSSVETAKRRGPDYYAVPWRGKFATELGGVLVTQAIHVHDLLASLVGPAAAVNCFKTTRVNAIEVEDCAVASLRLADGSLVSLAATLGAARQSTRLHMHFEHATIERDCLDDDSTRPADEPWIVVPKSDEAGRAIGKVMDEVAPQGRWFERQFELFHKAIADGEPLPITLDDARAALELVTAMFESADTGTTIGLPIASSTAKYRAWVPAASVEP